MTGLDQAQRDELRRRLEQDRETLRAEIDDIANNDVQAGAQYDPEQSGYGNHEAESGTEIYEQERNLALERNLEQQLADVEHALDKFAQGTYGICDVCGREIAPERLRVMPQAALCIDDAAKQQAQRVPQA